jgi:hypothetical protein
VKLSPISVPIEPIGIPFDTAIAISGLRQPTLLIAHAEGKLTVYRDGNLRIVDYASLRALMRSLPPWVPRKRRPRSNCTPPASEDTAA